MRRALLSGFAVATLAMGAAVQPAQADVSTSMTATISGGDILFTLSALDASPGTGWYLEDLTIQLLTSGFVFDGNLANVEIREGGPAGIDRTSNYSPNFVSGNLKFLSNSALDQANAALAPVWIKAGLSTTSGNMTHIFYEGDFFSSTTVATSGGNSFQGYVAPEPATMILLGTGLLGVGIVARRRRNDEDVDA